MTQPDETGGRCPMTAREVTDAYFMEHRAKVLDLAAFLDRLDRAKDAPQNHDFRVRALRNAIAILLEPSGGRAKRVLDLMSDPTREPIEAAPGKGASGAHAGLADRAGADRTG